MCNCPICEFTDSFADKSFGEWPKGEHINRSAKKDKAYSAHWRFCGAEAHKKLDKLDLRMRIGGKFYDKETYANLPHYKAYYQQEDNAN